MKKLTVTIYEHLILPVINNAAPVNQVSWAVAIGLFVGLTPTMGVQMYIIAIFWTVGRFICRFRFYLPVGVAMVWVSNPITVAPLYYLFLATGNFFLQAIEIPTISLSWVVFQQKFEVLVQKEVSEIIAEGSHFLFIDLGIPIFVGSLCYAIPFAFIFYFVTHVLLIRYRRYKADQENITYE